MKNWTVYYKGTDGDEYFENMVASAKGNTIDEAVENFFFWNGWDCEIVEIQEDR